MNSELENLAKKINWNWIRFHGNTTAEDGEKTSQALYQSDAENDCGVQPSHSSRATNTQDALVEYHGLNKYALPEPEQQLLENIWHNWIDMHDA